MLVSKIGRTGRRARFSLGTSAKSRSVQSLTNFYIIGFRILTFEVNNPRLKFILMAVATLAGSLLPQAPRTGGADS